MDDDYSLVNDKWVEWFKESGLLSDDQWEQAEKIAEEESSDVMTQMMEMGFIKEEVYLSVLGEHTNFASIRLWKCKIDPTAIAAIPRELAQEYHLIPLSKIGQVLTVAMLKPWDDKALGEVQQILPENTIVPVLTCREDIREAIDSNYGDDFESELKDVIQKMDDEEMHVVEEEGGSESVTDKSILLSLTDQEPVVRLTNSILVEGVKRGSSDIFIEPHATQLIVRYRVDGLLQEGAKPPKSMHQGVLSRLKIMSNLDIAEQRLPQDGRIKIKHENRWVEFRLSTLPTYYGEKACLRILDPDQIRLKLDILGFDDNSLESIKKSAASPYGMILVCGPTGSGKTTTLYSILNQVNGIEKNMVTVEDPVEYHLDGINQVNVRPQVGLTFAASLRSILRQDPDVVLIGEIRDRETMDIGVKAALTGHLVLSTLHTNSAAGSITRLANMGIEPFLITSSVVMAASQRLVRKLCEFCKEKYTADKQQIKILRLKSDQKAELYKAVGCDKCGNKGYKGRMSIIEILRITAAIKRLIIKGANENEIKGMARSEGMVTLRENAIQKVLEGHTTVDEALRVSMRDDEDENNAPSA